MTQRKVDFTDIKNFPSNPLILNRNTGTNKITITVSDTSGYPTLKSAFDFIDTIVNQATGESILIDVVVDKLMTEQLIIRGKNYGGVTITATNRFGTKQILVDTTSFQIVQGFTSTWDKRAFISGRNSIMPIIDANIDLQLGTYNEGKSIYSVSACIGSFTPFLTFKNVGASAVTLRGASTIFADFLIVRNSPAKAVAITSGSVFQAYGLDLDNVSQGLAVDFSVVSVPLIKIRNYIFHGITTWGGGTIFAYACDISKDGIVRGIDDVNCNHGSIINTSAGLGGSNIAFNTITSNGLVIR